MTEIVDYMREQGSLPSEALLGYVLISTCVDGQYLRDDIVELFEEQQLDTSLIPDVSGATDAFNKAVTANKESKYTLPGGDVISIMLRPVNSKRPNETITRAVIRERSDGGQAQLGYDAVGDLTLYKAPRVGGRVRATGARLAYGGVAKDALPEDVTDEELDKIRGIISNVRGDYDRYTTTLDGRKISRMVDAYLKRLGAIRLKDSVRFVPIKHGVEALRLCTAISAIGDCRLDDLPLVDLKGQREYVLRAFQEDTEAAMNSLAAEAVRAAAASSTSTPTVLARLRAQYDDLTKRTDSYVEMLGVSAARAEASHDITKAMLNRLAAAVRTKEGL